MHPHTFGTAPVPSCSNVLRLPDVERAQRFGELGCPAEPTCAEVLIDREQDRMF